MFRKKYSKQFFYTAVTYSECVVKMENTQSQLDQALKTQMQLLNDVQTGLSSNMKTIQEAIKQIEANKQMKK